MDEILESINRRLEENEGHITQLGHSPAYYVVTAPLRAGDRGIEVTEWMDRGNGLEPQGTLSIPIPDVTTPISETADGFVLNYNPGALRGGFAPVPGGMRFRYGWP